MSTIEQPAPKSNNALKIGIVIGVLAICFCVLAVGAVGGGIVLTNSWATATQQEFYIRETATQQESYARATATKSEEYARATATKQEQFARATATKAEQYAQATAQADTVFGMVPEGIAERFPNVLYYETFDDERGWTVGSEDNDYWAGERSIKTSFLWNIEKVYKTFFWWENISAFGNQKNFYFQVDARLVDGLASDSCYGLLFRKKGDNDFFMFLVCEGGDFFNVGHSKDDKWIEISDWQKDRSIKGGEMNRLGVSAEGSRFEIFINGDSVFSFEDDGNETGRLSLVIEKYDKGPAEYEFDNVIILTP